MPSRWILSLIAASCLGLLHPGVSLLAQGVTQSDIDKAMRTELPQDPAAVIAVVGESKVLYGEIKSRVDARIKEVLAQTGREVPQDQLHFARINLTRGLLAQTIQNKGMSELFLLDQVGTQGAEKRKEASEIMTSRARQVFYESEVPNLLEQHKAVDMIQLNDALKEKGSSLAMREREFMDTMLAHMYMKSAVNNDPPVTISEINVYYQQNQQDYAHKAQARWEQLSVLFENHTVEEAEKLIREIYQEAYYGGNLQAVAKKRSEEPFASDGGLHSWTNKGSLASKALDQQIFSIPLNKMSAIVRDDMGLHIIRVLERRPAGYKSLGQVQEDIEKKLKQEKVQKSRRAAMATLRKRIPVWTIFPEDVPGSKSLFVPQVATLPNAANY